MGLLTDQPPGQVWRPLPFWRGFAGVLSLRRWAVAALVANVGIVITGGLVRLTSSGLGCPTWPRCTEESYVPHPAYGIHGVIEFGNRLLTFVLVIVMVATLITALRTRLDGHRRLGVRWRAVVLLAGIPAQAVLGGFTVWSQLNPYVVALHFLLSMVLIAFAVGLLLRARALSAETLRRTDGPDGPGAVSTAQRVLLGATFGVAWLVLWLGTIVTGSGPHSGDLTARRTGLDPELVSHIHAVGAYVLLALTLAVVLWLRSRSALLLLVVEVGQAVVGLVQFNLGLPIWLVALHLLGASLTAAAVTFLLLRPRAPLRSKPIVANRT